MADPSKGSSPPVPTTPTTPPPARLVILGAGAIGTHLLQALRPGVPVLVVDTSQAVRAALGGRGVATSPPEGAGYLPGDVVLLATSACVAVRAIEGVPGTVPVICLANGLIPDLAKRAGVPVAMGVVEFASSCPSPGVATCTKPGWLTLQADAPAGITGWLADRLDPARQRVRLVDHIHDHRHAKLVLNSSLDPVAAVMGGTIGDVFATPGAFAAFRGLLGEGLAVARAAGWRLPPIQGTTPRAMARIFSTPILGGIARRVAAKQSRGIQSTLSRELARGELGEAEYLSGAIIREGARVGVQTPAHRRVMDVLAEIAREGRGGSAARLESLVRA